MMTQIGIVSGQILTFLEEKQSPITLKEVVFELDEAVEVILMSIGWLTREGLIHLESMTGKILIYSIFDRKECLEINQNTTPAEENLNGVEPKNRIKDKLEEEDRDLQI